MVILQKKEFYEINPEKMTPLGFIKDYITIYQKTEKQINTQPYSEKIGTLNNVIDLSRKPNS